MSVLILFPEPNLKAQSLPIAEFTVHSGKHKRVNVPVSASLERVPLQIHIGELQLFEITGGDDVLVESQLQTDSPDRLTWIVEGITHPGKIRSYELRISEDGQYNPGGIPSVNVSDDGKGLSLRIGEKSVLDYRYAPKGVPDGVPEIFSRGGYIHPIKSPEGEVLSRIQPSDHYHHYGIWNPWTRTEFEGREVDFWNLMKGEGTVRAEQVIEKNSGNIYGGFKALHNHIDFTTPDGEKTALNEQWEVKAWNADPDDKVWLIDFVSTLNPATEEPLVIKEYRYQGFSLRATEKWNDDNATLFTSEGYDKSNANATRARWIDVNGVSGAESGTSGILFMTNPANYNFPEQLRIWPVGANQGKENVYINFNPAQDRDWILQPGKSYTLKYRMLVYDGKMNEELANQYWNNYANPPKVDVHPVGALQGAKVLIYTKNGSGYVHDNIASSIRSIKEMGEEYGFKVDASDDPADFVNENLNQYDVLIFSNTNNDVFDNDDQRQVFQNYVRNGGGFLGIHSTTGAERNWPWFSKLVGGNFERHAPRQDFSVNVVDRGHPSTSFLSDRWDVIDDECYYLKEINPGIKVLLAADMTTVEDEGKNDYPGNIFGDSFPLAWYQEFDGGRQWYTSLGHRSEHYDDPVFMRHVLGGLQWVVNGITL
ncbi:MAG: ThuA domain-containing protein [Balneolales bacterium]